MKFTFAALFAYLSTTSALLAAEPETAEIRLASAPAQALFATKDKAVEVSDKRASKFRLRPGLGNSKLTSFELVGAKDYYLRHQKFILHLHEKPKLNVGFNADASFKIVPMEGEQVRLEAGNFPNRFLSVNEVGNVVLIANPTPEQSTFLLKK